jgi:uncharacterized protein DUF4136
MKLFGTVLGVLFLMTIAVPGFAASVKSDYQKTTYTEGCVMADIIDAKTQELVWRGVVQDTVNGIGQTDKQANNAAKDLVKRFMSDTRKLEKQNG